MIGQGIARGAILAAQDIAPHVLAAPQISIIYPAVFQPVSKMAACFKRRFLFHASLQGQADMKAVFQAKRQYAAIYRTKISLNAFFKTGA